jgi:predicted DCC family thiol-disulfide oxidoreductase YuxK
METTTAGYPPLVAQGDRVVLFDGVCKFCGFWARFLIRFDRRQVFKLATLQSPEGQAILQWFNFPTDRCESMVLVEGSRAYTKSTAVLRIAAPLPFPWPLGTVAWLVPRFIRDWLYDRIALNRYILFGKYEECVMPAPEQKRRFLNSRGPS